MTTTNVFTTRPKGKLLQLTMSCLAIFLAGYAHAAFDVNGDGKEGLAESIHALQVTAGMTPGTQPFYLSGRRITVCPANMGDCDFTGPIEALNSIPDDGDDTPAANNPYVIEMSEHSYDIGSNQLIMKPFVDIVGRTRTYFIPTTFTVTTIINGTINNGRGYPAQDNASIIGASNSRLENLHITNTVNGGTSTLIYCQGVSNFVLKDLELTKENGTDLTGIFADHASDPHVKSEIHIDNVTITLSSFLNDALGLYMRSSDALVDNLDVSIFNNTGTAGTAKGVTIYDESSLIMSSGTIDVAATDFTIGIRGVDASTIILNGKVVSESPYVTNIMILAQGGKHNYGAHLYESTLLSTNNIIQGAPSSDPQGDDYPRGVGVSSGLSTIAMVGGKIIADPMYGVSNGQSDKVALFDLIIDGDVGGNHGYGACYNVTRTFENGTEEILSTDCKRSE